MKKVVLSMSLVVILFLSCQKQSESVYYESESETAIESVEDAVEFTEDSELSSGIVTQTPKDRIFKKEGALDFEVKEVLTSTKKIETAVSKSGGFVLKSNLHNTIIDSETVVLNKDSAQRFIKSKAEAYIECKVPQHKMAYFLTSIESEVEILNYRNLEAEEMTLDFKLADLQTKSLDKINKKLDNTLNKGGKIDEESNVIDKIDAKESEKNYATYHKLKMKDEVKWVTFSLNLEGKETIKEIKVANLDSFESARNPFFYDMKNSLSSGYHLFLDFVIMLSHLWIFIIAFVVLMVGYKKYKNTKLKKVQQD